MLGMQTNKERGVGSPTYAESAGKVPAPTVTEMRRSAESCDAVDHPVTQSPSPYFNSSRV